MSETVSEVRPQPTMNGGSTASSARPAKPVDNTDRPVPLWPEGVVAAVAGIALLVIGLRHRTYLERKAKEAQRAVEEFQRHGGMEDLTQVAKQAVEYFRGATG